MKTLLQRDRDFFYKAFTLAHLSEYRFTRVGAVAAHNRKILGGAFNVVRNNTPNMPFGTATIHAECLCLRMVPDRLLTRITLYVARISRAGEAMPSKPCHRCMGEMAQRGVREVVFFDGSNIRKQMFQ